MVTAKQNEEMRLLKMDLDPDRRRAAYGYRMRCRGCNEGAQVNLLQHAEGFMKKHEECYEANRPRLS